MARTIQSPGVEIKEIDLTLRANLPIGTYVMVPGFADRGPTDEVVQVTSQTEFENIYGLPTTPAERYFYHSVRPLFNSPANVLTYRLPYGADKGAGFGNSYGVLAYPSKLASISQTGLGETALNSVGISLNFDPAELTTNGLSGASFLLQGSSGKTYSFAFGFGGAGPLRLPTATGAALSASVTTNALSSVTEVMSLVSGTIAAATDVVGTGKEFDNLLLTGNVLTFNLSASDTIPLGTNAAVQQSFLGGLSDPGDVFSAEQTTGTTPAGASNFGDTLATFDEQANDVLAVLGKPTHFELTQAQYNDILTGNTFSWSNQTASTFAGVADLGKAAMLVLNKGQTTIDQRFQGFYIGALDNTNLNDATDFDGILSVETVAQSAEKTTNYTTLPGQRLDFSLSSISDNNTSTFGQDTDSISEIMENLNDFDISSNLFDDTVSLGLFRLRQSPFTSDTIKLGFTLAEGYVGTFDYHRQIQNQNGGPPSKFSIETQEDQSPNVNVLVNEFLSHKNGSTYLDVNGVPTNKIRFASSKIDSSVTTSLADRTAYFTNLSASYGAQTEAQAQTLSGVVESFVSFDVRPADSLYPIGTYADSNAQSKDLGSIPSKLDRLFDSVENPDIYELDLTVDGGLTTINAVAEFLEREGKGKYFDDTVDVSKAIDGFYTSNLLNISDEAIAFRSDWKTVFDRFAQFAEFRRKDHLFIADLPRHIFVQGTNFKTLNDDSKNFSLNISSPLRAFTAVTNTSYATTYANWAQVYDTGLDDQTWVPFSGNIAATMVNTDSNFQPWFAPAGFTRGVVTGVNDLALYPKQKQRDQLYKNSINPIAFFPNEGYVVFGQKTLLKKPSAFDRINVRRLFLYLEKATSRTVKYFVFDPNTLLTRTRVINTIQPIFENVKNTEGVYDYLLVCDERNNTPSVIDQNELIVDIYLKPVRAAEFILVNFYATRTGANFNELI